MQVRTQANYIHTAKMEGLAAGRAEGLELGKAEGLELGKAEGKAEMKQETAREMKNLGIPLQQIMDVTGFSEEEIGKI